MQRRFGRGGARKIDSDLELARRLDRAIRFEPGDLAVEVALLALRVADRGVGARDFVGDHRERSAPLGDRTRLALLANSRRRGFRKTLGEFAARRGGGNRTVEIGALVPQGFDALVDFGLVDLRHGARRAGVDRANGEFCCRLTLDPQRGRVERQREILRHHRGVARGQIECNDARDAGAIGIDGDGLDRRIGVNIGRPRRHCGKRGNDDHAGRDETVRNRSH